MNTSFGQPKGIVSLTAITLLEGWRLISNEANQQGIKVANGRIVVNNGIILKAAVRLFRKGGLDPNIFPELGTFLVTGTVCGSNSYSW
jgi:hypothetical protein